MSSGTFPHRPEPQTKRKLPIGRWVAVVSFLFIAYAWTFGPYGIVRQSRTAQDLERLRARNDSLAERIHILTDSLELLTKDSATISDQARRQGLVLPGEISVRFVDTTSR